MGKWTATAKTEALWRERLQAWRASGMTAEKFAQSRGYRPSTLTYLSWRLNRPKPRVFVPIVARPAATTVVSEMAVEIGAARVRVRRGFDAALLGEIVRALGAGGR